MLKEHVTSFNRSEFIIIIFRWDCVQMYSQFIRMVVIDSVATNG